MNENLITVGFQKYPEKQATVRLATGETFGFSGIEAALAFAEGMAEYGEDGIPTTAIVVLTEDKEILRNDKARKLLHKELS